MLAQIDARARSALASTRIRTGITTPARRYRAQVFAITVDRGLQIIWALHAYAKPDTALERLDKETVAARECACCQRD